MSLLVVTIGLPGCGKSTRARRWVAERPDRRARVNRDDLRSMLHGGRLGTGPQEAQVTAAAHAAIEALLAAGVDVVVDDASWSPSTRRRFASSPGGAAPRCRCGTCGRCPCRCVSPGIGAVHGGSRSASR